jgi:hypothetical protein
MNKLATRPVKPVLVVDQLLCPLDDGHFRLVQEDTLDAIANDIRYLHEKSVTGGQQQILFAFLCGVALARARAKLPKAKRGPQADGQGGIENWMQDQFPTISSRTLKNYAAFAQIVYLQAKDLNKTATVAVLSKSPLDFQFNPDKARELLGVIGTAMDGKSMTELCRSQKILREAATMGGDKGNHKARRTKAEIEAAKIEADAEIAYAELAGSIDLALKDHRFARLTDAHLAALRERVVELKDELDVHCSRRKLHRLPGNWRLTENLPHA